MLDWYRRRVIVSVWLYGREGEPYTLLHACIYGATRRLRLGVPSKGTRYLLLKYTRTDEIYFTLEPLKYPQEKRKGISTDDFSEQLELQL